ncbi:uncharacterized protein LOC132273734 [Cornus florida]|uniref:uncharacterized protein LOC132273734 n=1 Tax=Cornus florida TaxID=4283 RepID=UPI0028A017C2|nr:uncharacterized protein LOC132273734 [Cornus florida]
MVMGSKEHGRNERTICSLKVERGYNIFFQISATAQEMDMNNEQDEELNLIVTMLVGIVAYLHRNRSAKFYFKRSGETISRHFNTIIDAIIGMEDNFLKQPTLGTETPNEIRDNNRMWPYFKDCVGAIDGTHLPAKVPIEYLDGNVQQPILEFYIVLRIEDINLHVLQVILLGRYRLSSFGTLYYPIQKYTISPKRNTRTLDEPMFGFENQVRLVIACCIIHNHIRGVMPDDPLLNDVDHEIGTQSAPIHDPIDNQLTRAEDGREGKRIRTQIMNEMWNDFSSRR